MSSGQHAEEIGFRARTAWAGTLILMVTSFTVLGSFFISESQFSLCSNVDYDNATPQGV